MALMDAGFSFSYNRYSTPVQTTDLLNIPSRLITWFWGRCLPLPSDMAAGRVTSFLRHFCLGGDTVALSGLYARLCHTFSSLFNDLSETNYLRIRWNDFRNLFSEWKRVGADDQSRPFFRYLKGRCHGKKFCAKNGKLSIFVALAFRNGMG